MQIAKHMSSKVQGQGIGIELDSLTFGPKYAVVRYVSSLPRGTAGFDVFLVTTCDSEAEAREAANKEWRSSGY